MKMPSLLSMYVFHTNLASYPGRSYERPGYEANTNQANMWYPKFVKMHRPQEHIRKGGLSNNVQLQYKLVVWSKNCTKNRTSGHVLSNNGLCLCSMCSACYYF